MIVKFLRFFARARARHKFLFFRFTPLMRIHSRLFISHLAEEEVIYLPLPLSLDSIIKFSPSFFLSLSSFIRDSSAPPPHLSFILCFRTQPRVIFFKMIRIYHVAPSGAKRYTKLVFQSLHRGDTSFTRGYYELCLGIASV